MWAVYSGEVRCDVGTRSRMCYVGWAVWVHRGVLDQRTHYNYRNYIYIKLHTVYI